MNPLWTAALGAILRWALAFGAGYLIRAGIWTASEAESYVVAASLGLIALVWGQHDKLLARAKLLIALALPAGSTEQDVKTKLALKPPPLR